MSRKSNQVKFVKTLLIILLISASIIFVFKAEIKQKLHSLDLCYKEKKIYRIIFLVNNMTENSILNASSIKVYSTLCTLGLAKEIENTFLETGQPYELVYYETDRQEALNQTYLDSFDLIVVGGITYWWIYASTQEKEALISTEKSIIASANLGLNSTPAVNNLVGVYHQSESDYEAWRAVLPMNTTLITYTDIKQLDGKSTISRIHLIQDLSLTTNSKLYAYAERDGKKHPYIVFNGTKNYYMNTFTYEGIEQIKLDIAFILDVIFDLFEDEYLLEKIWGTPTPEKKVANMLVILVSIFLSFITSFGAIKHEYTRGEGIKIRIEKEKLEKTIYMSTLTLFLIMLVVFFFKTYAFPLDMENYFSTECLVTFNCVLIALTSILLFCKGNLATS